MKPVKLSNKELNIVSGAGACTNAFELSYGVIGGSVGMIFGPAGGLAGFGAGYSFGSFLAEGMCRE